MSSATKSNLDFEQSADLQAIKQDMAALKDDLATLVRNLNAAAPDELAHTRGTVGQLGDDARRAYEELAARGQRSLKAIGHRVEEKPAMSLLIAFAAGFIGSRVLLR